MQRWSSFVFVYSVCKSPCLVQPIGTRGWHSICVQPIASQNHSHVISKKFLGVVQGVLAPLWPPFWLIVIFYHNYIPHPMCNCFNEKNVTFTQSTGEGPCSKAKTHQIVDSGFLNCSKTPLQTRDMVFLEYNCPKPVASHAGWLELACLPGMHFDLDSFPMAGSLPSVDSGFLNFSKRPLLAWETSVWTWMSSICQIWPNSSDGCPLWAAVARPPEVLLTWILFYLLDNCKLFKKLKFILVFTVFASIVSGFWPFLFTPPLENPPGFSRGVIIFPLALEVLIRRNFSPPAKVVMTA